ncbi:hypothetical protein SAMN05660826_02115 [Caldanaerovirga acetigignens]|uniref:Uncharacterized protein n=1 Tax=Caldanaerovirga acetigignens TaxID=447595 RepID=A0A1M7M109_9FIRM|nr:hypothetical protein SAMN05660826_02115 [Caldanaerovirga acetigignens]
MNCPLCGGNSTGKVGNNQYYCWDCYVEFSVNHNKVTIYELADDGTLLPYGRNEAARGGNAF